VCVDRSVYEHLKPKVNLQRSFEALSEFAFVQKFRQLP
jgi:hypothetical protein